MRAPIWVYRARMGSLLGSRVLMVEHVGRRSGIHREVVLEVVGHRAPDVYVVASAFGSRAQWFRNVQADPRVRLTTRGHHAAPGVARVLTAAEGDAVLEAYIARHPAAWAVFKGVLESTLAIPLMDRPTGLPMVELRLGRQVS
jgi:deazaflavin-dependent oxidoreductase (nitroreductase family)